jgi:hypothetical protein
MPNIPSKVSAKPVFITIMELFIKALVCVAVSLLMFLRFAFDVIPFKFNATITFTIILLFFILFLLFSDSFITSKNIFMNTSTGKQPRRLVIFLQDVKNIHDCSGSTASRKIKEVKDHYAKEDHQVITIKEYCSYFAIDYMEVCKLLKII